jgi:hypothetical protein
MKRSVLIGTLVLVLAALVVAPASAAIQIQFGLKAGVSASNVKWSDDDGSEQMLIQPTFGGFIVVPLGSTLAIQPEVNYIVHGEKWTDDGTITEKFGYLQVPVLLRIKLMQEGKVVPILFAGPAVSFLMSATESGFGDVKEFFKSTDMGAVIGVGGIFGQGKTKGLVDLRYVLGFTNNYNFENDYSMKTAAFVLTGGIIF